MEEVFSSHRYVVSRLHLGGNDVETAIIPRSRVGRVSSDDNRYAWVSFKLRTRTLRLLFIGNEEPVLAKE
jgi:hypothetical protein